MKKILICLLLISTLCLSGCERKVRHWEFHYGHEDVTEIKVVDLLGGTYDNATGFVADYYVLQEIDISRAQEIYNDILQLEMYRIGGTIKPSTLGIAFLIVFRSGEYDVITRSGPGSVKYYQKENGLELGSSWLRCNDEQFEALLDKYIED